MRILKKSAQVHKGTLRPNGLKGFTLVELLVVIAIIAILAAVVVLIINPLELTRRGRDAARLTDLANLQQAINVAVQEASNSGSNIACNSTDATCNRSSVSGGAGRATNGTGWVAVNLGVQTSVSVPTLPVDPTNSSGNTGFHYAYCGSGDNWEIFTRLESDQQTGNQGNVAASDKRQTDGGTNNNYYEVGSVLNLAGTTDGGEAGCLYSP
ncbi:prepilin-type N-terminal cleavage/methylation domain-containing protein [Patescibacteria group bacterium]|nr:prepilin-type N-terminal cleavage/methylation domain-containing protein [Patescibacteria group bacterium]